jgi:FkbM family methyltransferase
LPALLATLRAFAWIRNIYGGQRAALWLVHPSRQAARDYLLDNDGLRFWASPNSYLEWNLILFKQYEGPQKKLFIEGLPSSRRRTLLDIGANVGSHSIDFARHFARVASFEPNAEIARRFVRNVQENRLANVELHQFGLAADDGVLKFYAPDVSNVDGNMGTGTFMAEFAPRSYNLIEAAVRNGDAVVAELALHDIDAIKIDVQGFEARVLQGLSRTLAKYAPHIWIEISDTTLGEIAACGGLAKLIPFRHEVYQFETQYRCGLVHQLVLNRVRETNISTGDLVIVPT